MESRLAEIYCDSPLHNFAHASKEVTRVLENKVTEEEEGRFVQRLMLPNPCMWKGISGITSDRFTLFECVFSAPLVVHDFGTKRENTDKSSQDTDRVGLLSIPGF